MIFHKIFLFLFLVMLTSLASSSIVKGQCGGVEVFIKISSIYPVAAEFTLSYKINSQKQKIFYGPAGDRMSIACLKDKNNRTLLVWEEACSGSVCSDDGVYGIFDPQTKKLLLKPKDLTFDDYKGKNLDRYIDNKIRKYEKKNHQQAAELLGYQPPILFHYKDSFCCTQS